MVKSYSPNDQPSDSGAKDDGTPQEVIPPPTEPELQQQKSVLNKSGFGTKPAETTCSQCHQAVTTEVDDAIRDEGWCWCVLCSCLFAGIVGRLVCCMKGFKKFTHTCPKCDHILAVVKPKFTTKEKIIIFALITFLLVLFIVLMILNISPIKLLYEDISSLVADSQNSTSVENSTSSVNQN